MTFIKPHRILQRNLRSGFTFVHRVKRSIDYLCIVVKKLPTSLKIVCWLGYGALSLYKNALMFITTVGVPFLIKLRWPRVEKRKFWELGREIRQQSKMRSFNFGSEYIKWTDESFPRVDSSGSVFNDPSDLRALSICPNWSARPFPLFPSQWQFPF